jgi:hypothetical protein
MADITEMGINDLTFEINQNRLYLKIKDSSCITEPNRVMLFREIIAVYCENHMEHTDAMWVKGKAILETGRGGP